MDVTDRRGSSGTLLATCVSALVVNANTSAVAILLPAISDDTGTPVSTLQWAVTGYSLVGAATIVTAGALGDVFGRRKIFLGGLLLFVASCAMIALAQGGGGVIAGRCIQGAAGSTILACGMSLLSAANTGEEQLRAVTLWGAASAIGAAAGPLVGGLLVEVTGWQGLFWIDAVIAAACIPLTLARTAESRDPNRSRSIDFPGTLLIALTLAALIFALSKGQEWGWLSGRTIGCLVLSVAALVAFVVVEQRRAAPLLDLRLLRNKVLVGATVSILIGSGTLNAIMYVISLYFQDPATLGMSALQAGLATLPVAAAAVILAPLITPIVGKIGARTTIVSGFVIMTVAFVWLAFVDDSWKYAAFVVPLVASAVGMSLQNGPASSISTAVVSPDEVGAASGVSNMARYVGASVMTAIVASIYAGVSAHRVAAGDSTAGALAAGVSRTAIAMALWCVLGVLVALLIGRLRPGKPRPLDYATAAAGTTHTLHAPAARAQSSRSGAEVPAA
ncbi:MAG: MFS transporter [Hamadaea sp.]|nr:MFS transporter [Hamadaea sp.]